MKFIAIVGTNASKSYNRRLLHFMKKHFAAKAEIVIKEIKEYPLFCEDFDETPHSIMELATEIDHSDGVIFATPEYDHGIPAALKSVIEWLSYDVHPLTNRPVMIVGASLGNLGTVYAQDDLRRILDSPGLGPYVLPGHQFLLGHAPSAFDKNDNLNDDRTISWLDTCFDGFIKYAVSINSMAGRSNQADATTGASSKPRETPVIVDLRTNESTVDASTSASKTDKTNDYGIDEKTFGLVKSSFDETTGASSSNAEQETSERPVIVNLRHPEMAVKADSVTGASQA